MSKNRKNSNRRTPSNQKKPPSQVTRVNVSWQGPLPPPSTLAKFEELLPGATERIVAMAERQQEHDHFIEKENAKTVAFEGQYFNKVRRDAFILSLGGLAITGTVLIKLLWASIEWFGQGMNAAGIGAVVAAFVAGLPKSLFSRKGKKKQTQ